MNSPANPFYTINLTESEPLADDINRIFGKPFKIPIDRWPQQNGKTLHHIMTLSTEGINMLISNEVVALSVFCYFDQEEGFEGPFLIDSFKVIPLTRSDLSNVTSDYFPQGYKPWWNLDDLDSEIYTKGVTFTLNHVSQVSEDYIRKILSSDVEVEDIPLILEDLEEEFSLVGGFPIWLQRDEIPVAPDGNFIQYIMTINGYSSIFESSIIGQSMLYLFLDETGNAYWVDRS